MQALDEGEQGVMLQAAQTQKRGLEDRGHDRAAKRARPSMPEDSEEDTGYSNVMLMF